MNHYIIQFPVDFPWNFTLNFSLKIFIASAVSSWNLCYHVHFRRNRRNRVFCHAWPINSFNEFTFTCRMLVSALNLSQGKDRKMTDSSYSDVGNPMLMTDAMSSELFPSYQDLKPSDLNFRIKYLMRMVICLFTFPFKIVWEFLYLIEWRSTD